MPSDYQQFIKTHYPEVKHLPNLERMGALAKLWKARGSHSANPTTTKRKGVAGGRNPKGGVLSAAGLQGKGFLSDLLSGVGL